MHNKITHTIHYKFYLILFIKFLVITLLGIILIRFTIEKLVPLREWNSTPIELLQWNAIFNLDIFFSSQYAPIDWVIEKDRIKYSISFVFIAMIWSTSISYLLGYKLAQKPHSRIWDTFEFLTTLASGIPVFIIGLLILFVHKDLVFIKIILGGIVLGSCESALTELPRNIRNIITKLSNNTYYLAYLSRGQNIIPLIHRQVKPYLWQSFGTRISYMFGAVIVLEKAIGVTGIGSSFIKDIVEPYTRNAFCYVMLNGVLIILIPALFMVITNIKIHLTNKL